MKTINLQYFLLRILSIFILSIVLISCGGGGGGDSSTGDPVGDGPTDTPDDTSQVISGFDFALKEDDYWEYEWDYYTSTVSAEGPSSSTKKGVFRITLGAPVTFGELTAYPLIMTGNNRSGIDDVTPFITPRWTHIAINNNRVLLSSDGVDFKTVFDANTGYVIGYGFFEVLSDENLFEVTSGTIDNDYITGSAYVLADSASESNCQFFPGSGTICGADTSVDFTMVRREYYQPSIGPVGYFYDFSSSSGGTFTSVHVTNTINIGLVASSTRGDVVDYALETEPNNTPATASPITVTSFPASVKGDLNHQADIDAGLPENFATNYRYYVNSRPENEPNDSVLSSEPIQLNESIQGDISSSDSGEFKIFQAFGTQYNTIVEDIYSFVVTQEMADILFGSYPFDIHLEFYDAGLVDIDLYLMNSSGEIFDYSLSANGAPDGSLNSEYLRADLVPGTYYIGVDMWPAAGGGESTGSYTLSVTETSVSSGLIQDVVNGYWIADFYELDVATSTSLSLYATPSVALFLTNQDGTSVIASARPVSTGPITTPTILATPVLQPGTYLIGVSYGLNVDKYELSVTNEPPVSAQ